MCEYFIKNFTEKVIKEIDYINCKDDIYYKNFDENLIKMVTKINFHRDLDVETDFYVDLAVYFFHKDVKRFVEVLKVLSINQRYLTIGKIADRIKYYHKDCVPEDENTIIFTIYDNVSWKELSYIMAEDRQMYFGEKQKMNFKSWLNIFLNNFTN